MYVCVFPLVCRYASLYFCCGSENQDNELLALEILHRYVELLDKYFGNVNTFSFSPLETILIYLIKDIIQSCLYFLFIEVSFINTIYIYIYIYIYILCIVWTQNFILYSPSPHLFIYYTNFCLCNIILQVCELDIIFNFEKAYFILDEFLMGGEIQETSKQSIAKSVEASDMLQEVRQYI